MFERLNDQARQLIVRAQEEARALKHHYVGAEHLLLALTRDDSSSVAARTLAAIDVTRERVLALVAAAAGEPGDWRLPFTPQAREVLDTACYEAGNEQISAEHFLLALAPQTDGAGRTLHSYTAAIRRELAGA